jgi:hypothetical protein
MVLPPPLFLNLNFRRCYKVKCVPSTFTDGYGTQMDCEGACHGDASVVVTITDSCPCDYPGNAYTNKR